MSELNSLMRSLVYDCTRLHDYLLHYMKYATLAFSCVRMKKRMKKNIENRHTVTFLLVIVASFMTFDHCCRMWVELIARASSQQKRCDHQIKNAFYII